MRAKFIGSFTEGFPKDEKKHVVFIGRSNVGKSSLINMIVGTNIAKVSKEPGRTRSVNFFLLEDYNLYLVDLPGYGFAKVSKAQRERWKKLIEDYIRECWENIKLVFLLMDSLVGPTELDFMAAEWLEAWKIPYLVVFTKSDKASQKDISLSLSRLREKIDSHVILTSSKEGKGKKELLKYALS